jgi:hypothetical protein
MSQSAGRGTGAGRLVIVDHYTREEIRANPGAMVVFGDNLERIGLGGQAGAARGEPNAVGIPTLHGPAGHEDAYFSDADLDVAKAAIDPAFELLLGHLQAGGDVWWPSAGVGTGIALLPQRAPAVFAYIEGWLARLRDAAG